MADPSKAASHPARRRDSIGPIGAFYGVYSLLVFSLVALVTVCLLALTPSLERRRRIARRAARMVFRLVGVPLQARRLELLGNQPCVVVANHASYLDGIILTAALPATFTFVIKNEVTKVPLLHLLLRRLDSQFVNRSDRHRGGIDARRILRRAHDGQALAFFPEGTFRREPGLRRFHSGAFATAARAQLPVIPVIIRGSRGILPAGTWLPRRGRVEVIVQSAVRVPGCSVEAANRLRDGARRAILAQLGEPDLALQRPQPDLGPAVPGPPAA